MSSSESDVIDLMISHELALGRLYTRFALAFPRLHVFWETLAREEQERADGLGVLRADPGAEAWLVHRSGVKPQAIKSSVEYIDDLTTKPLGSLTVIQALSAARGLESALIEVQFSKIDPAACTGSRTVLLELAKEAERHRRVISEALSAEMLGGW